MLSTLTFVDKPCPKCQQTDALERIGEIGWEKGLGEKTYVWVTQYQCKYCGQKLRGYIMSVEEIE